MVSTGKRNSAVRPISCLPHAASFLFSGTANFVESGRKLAQCFSGESRVMARPMGSD